MGFRVITRREEAECFLTDVCRRADENRSALGFLPQGVYRETLEQGKLIIGVHQVGRDSRYAGHVMFGGVFPHGRIFQVFVDPEFRGAGYARILVESVLEEFERFGYLDAAAKVADDLPANSFWQHLGFDISRQKAGGQTTGRTINVRIRPLATPNLFSEGSFTASLEPNLQFTERLASTTPVYLIDLNVFFDITQKRLRKQEASLAIQAAFKNLIGIRVADEFVEELRRNSPASGTDPVLEFALALPRLPRPVSAEFQELLVRLTSVLELGISGSISQNDQSDMVHIATAIHHKVAGFITSDAKILRKRHAIQEHFGLDVIGVEELASLLEDFDAGDSKVVNLAIGGLTVQSNEVKDVASIKTAVQFLESIGTPGSFIEDVTKYLTKHSSSKSLALTASGRIITLAAWKRLAGISGSVQLFLANDDSDSISELTIDFALSTALKDSTRIGPSMVNLLFPQGSNRIRHVAIVHGFSSLVGKPELSRLDKLAVGTAITASNWTQVRSKIVQVSGVLLPEHAPQFQDVNSRLEVRNANGKQSLMRLFDLERLFSPVLFALPGRSAVIVPIQARFVAELLGASPQATLMQFHEATLVTERVYFSSPNTLARLQEGMPILFYESIGRGDGRGAVVAAARILRTALHDKSECENLRRRGVLDESSMNEILSGASVAGTVFDNVLVFQQPVRLDKLRTMGCVDGSNLVTAKVIEANQFEQLILEGAPIAGF